MNKSKKFLLRLFTFVAHPSSLIYYKNFKGTVIYPHVVLKNAKNIKITNSVISRYSALKAFPTYKKQICMDIENSYLADRSYLSSRGGLIIREMRTASPNLFIGTYKHSLSNYEKDSNYNIFINKPHFIGQNVSIFGNVNIEENVVIGACTVVTKSIPKNTLVVGNPARAIKKWDDSIKSWVCIES